MLRPVAAAVVGALAPVAAEAGPLSFASVFGDAAPLQKLLMLALIIATLAAVAITGRKLLSRSQLAGGSAFVASLRIAGPLVGVVGAAFAVLRMSAGLASISVAPTLKTLAPAFAEAAALVALGFLAGSIAAALNGALEAKIDRQVLASAD